MASFKNQLDSLPTLSHHNTAMVWAGRGFAAKQSLYQKDMALGFFEVALQHELLALQEESLTQAEQIALSLSVATLAYHVGNLAVCLEYCDKVLALNPPAETIANVDILLDMAKDFPHEPTTV